MDDPKCSRWLKRHPISTVKDNIRPEGKFKTEEVWVDGYEVARRTGLNVRTIWQLARLGKIPRIKLGRRVMFDWDDVSRALRNLDSSADEGTTSQE